MPCPSNSSSILTRDRAPVSSGSTVTSTIARIGPSMPCTAQLLGGSSLTSSEADSRSTPPIRRVIVHFEQTVGVLPPSMLPRTTPACHSANVVGSVT